MRLASSAGRANNTACSCAQVSFSVAAITPSGQTISTVQPGPAVIANSKPCNFTIAATRLRPKPNPSVPLLLSDR